VSRARAQRLARRGLGPAHPAALRRWRALQAAHRRRRVAALTREFVAWHGLRVSGGPFAGLTYPDASAKSLIPKLLGVYERELHAAVEAAIAAEPEVVVNVGAADGYYAVGLARRCPAAAVHAFEADAAEHALLERVATANGVDLRIAGAARPEDLPAGRMLLVIDCEGCEAALLQADRLRSATVIAELHDFVVPGDPIVARFADTHAVQLIQTGPQPPPRGDAVALALSEYRPGPMRWAVMIPR
jgi:precorrin-6B methylase 2